jgi:hypothetical protein
LHADDSAGFFGKFPSFGASPEPVDLLLGDELVAIDVHGCDPAAVAPAQARGPASAYLVEPEVEIYPTDQNISIHKES